MKIIFTFVSMVFVLSITFMATGAIADEIFGCYKVINGQLRIVNDHSECLPSELPISLSVSNPLEPAPIPDLVGTWVVTSPMKCFAYENYLLPDQLPEYSTITGVSLTITTQNEEVFAGILAGPEPDPGEPPTYLTGIVQNSRIIIQSATEDVWHRINFVLDLTNGQQKLVGTFEQFENQATASNPGIMSCTFEMVKQ